MGDLGYPEEGKRRIENTIRRASTLDPDMTVYDIYGNTERPGAVRLDGGRKNEIHWGKSFWVFEQLRGMDPEFLSNTSGPSGNMFPPEWTTAITWMTP